MEKEKLLYYLYSYNEYKKDDQDFLDIHEDEELLEKIKSFNTSQIFLSSKYLILVNDWYKWYCQNETFKAPRHIIFNPTGITYQDMIDNIPHVIVEGDHIFFEGGEFVDKYFDIPVYELHFGS